MSRFIPFYTEHHSNQIDASRIGKCAVGTLKVGDECVPSSNSGHPADCTALKAAYKLGGCCNECRMGVVMSAAVG